MPYVAKEPNKKLITAGILVSVLLIIAVLSFSLTFYIKNRTLVLKKPMVLLLIGINRDSPSRPASNNLTNLPGTAVVGLTFIDPARHMISLVTIPRDSLVVIPGHGLDRINQAAVLGGYHLTEQAVTGLTGIKIDRYAMINFSGLVQLVDLLGGVAINVDEKIAYAADDGENAVNLVPGLQVLDGKKALQYVSFKNELPGGISISQRQRILLKAVYKKIMQPESLLKIPELIKLKKKYLKTDLTTKELIQLAGLAQKVDPDSGLQYLTLPGKFTESYWQTDPDQVYQLMSKLKSIN